MDIRNDLIPLHAQPLAAVFDKPEAMAKVLAQIETAALAETADPATEDGRTSIKSLAYKVSRSKTALEDVGKPLADAARLDYDKINAIRKTAKEFLDALRDDIRKPVNDWEAVEKARVMALGIRLNEIENLGLVNRVEGSGLLGQTISRVEAIEIGDSWREAQDDAAETKATALTNLRRELEAAKEEEAKEAELETLRAEKLEREAADAERDREAAIAERERVAAENARKQAKIDADTALEREKERGQREFDRQQRELAEANLRAERAATAERERIEAEQAVGRAEKERRENDEARRKVVIEAAQEALIVVTGIDNSTAHNVVGAIADKLIPGITINF